MGLERAKKNDLAKFIHKVISLQQSGVFATLCGTFLPLIFVVGLHGLEPRTDRL